MTPPLAEPLSTGWLLAATGLLLAVSVLVSRWSQRTGVPAVLVFLVIGMLAGSEGPGRLAFENYGLAFRLGSAALVMCLAWRPRTVGASEINERWQRHGTAAAHMMATRLCWARSSRRWSACQNRSFSM